MLYHSRLSLEVSLEGESASNLCIFVQGPCFKSSAMHASMNFDIALAVLHLEVSLEKAELAIDRKSVV